MAKPTRLPCPWWLIHDAPALATASGPVYRNTIVLADAYWRAGCVLPWHDESTIAALCRMPIAHVRPIKPAIIHALSQITPDLDKERARLVKARAAKVRVMKGARDVWERNRSMERANIVEPIAMAAIYAPAMVHEETKRQGPSQRERERRGNAQPPSPATNASTPTSVTFTDRPVITPPEGGDDN